MWRKEKDRKKKEEKKIKRENDRINLWYGNKYKEK